MRLVGLEELARVRFENHGAGGASRFAGLGDGQTDQRLMAAMHAIEIADRHHRTPRKRRHVAEAVNDLHGGFMAVLQ